VAAKLQRAVSKPEGATLGSGLRSCDSTLDNFYRGAYGRDATTTEIQTQRDALNAAAAQGQSQVQSQAETFGRSLFAAQVSDYSISDQQFVTNLYESFLQRGPDAGGLGFWTSIAGGGSSNRQNVLNSFATCGSFYALADTLYREEFWLVTDHLGTPLIIVDKGATLGSGLRSCDSTLATFFHDPRDEADHFLVLAHPGSACVLSPTHRCTTHARNLRELL
jgi:hypothetical protein